MQVLFLVTHGPKNEGFVAVDDFETFTVEEGTSCKIDPPEADPHYNPPTTLSPTSSQIVSLISPPVVGQWLIRNQCLG